MTYLLDTNTWLWLVESPVNLSTKAVDIVSKVENAPLGLSVISAWEVAKKVSRGKLSLLFPLRDWMSQARPGIALFNRWGRTEGVSLDRTILLRDPGTDGWEEFARLSATRNAVDYQRTGLLEFNPFEV